MGTMNLEQMKARVATIDAKLEKINQTARDPYLEEMSNHFHLGLPGRGGNRKRTVALNKRRSGALDRSIEAAKKTAPLYSERRHLLDQIHDIESGARQRREDLAAARLAESMTVKVGDIVEDVCFGPREVLKVNRKTVTLRLNSGTIRREFQFVRAIITRAEQRDPQAIGKGAEELRDVTDGRDPAERARKRAAGDIYDRRYRKVKDEIRKLERYSGLVFEPFQGNERFHRLALEDTLLFRIAALRQQADPAKDLQFKFRAEIANCQAALEALDRLDRYNFTAWNDRGGWPLEIVDTDLTLRNPNRREGHTYFVSFGWIFHQWGAPDGYVSHREPTPELEEKVADMFRATMKMEYPGIKIIRHELPMALTFEMILDHEEPRIVGSARVLLGDIAEVISRQK